MTLDINELLKSMAPFASFLAAIVPGIAAVLKGAPDIFGRRRRRQGEFYEKAKEFLSNDLSKRHPFLVETGYAAMTGETRF